MSFRNVCRSLIPICCCDLWLVDISDMFLSLACGCLCVWVLCVLNKAKHDYFVVIIGNGRVFYCRVDQVKPDTRFHSRVYPHMYAG